LLLVGFAKAIPVALNAIAIAAESIVLFMRVLHFG
jgi:hypothetical protein